MLCVPNYVRLATVFWQVYGRFTRQGDRGDVLVLDVIAILLGFGDPVALEHGPGQAPPTSRSPKPQGVDYALQT